MMPVERVVQRRKNLLLAEQLWEKADSLIDAGRHRKGFRLCKKAAHLGSQNAKILLGVLYNGHPGIPHNARAALRWDLRAYRQGPGWMVANSIGITLKHQGRDLEALRWFEVALGHGDLEPHLEIAKMYLESPARRELALPHLRAILRGRVPRDVCEDSHEEAAALLSEHFPDA